MTSRTLRVLLTSGTRGRKSRMTCSQVRPFSHRLASLLGIAVTFAILPDAVAFAAVARVPTIVGLYAAFFMCLIGLFTQCSSC